jgi:hypothetical protein
MNTIFDEMIGQKMTEVSGNQYDDEMIFTADNGRRFVFYYEPDCCARCSIEEVIGDLDDLVGSPILEAEEVSSDDAPEPASADESYTWTFYRFATAKGSVVVRWLGTSNGWYSESVSFRIIEPKGSRQ